jgi:chaperonin GroEL
VNQIRADIERTDSDYEREQLMQRLARLAGGVAVIRVGAPTEGERTQRQRRVEHAVRAANAAVETGLVPGGEVTLARVAIHLRDRTSVPPDHAKGFGLVAESLSAPFRALVHNAGQDVDSTLAGLLRRPATTVYDAVANEFVTAFPHRLIDPAAVPRAALAAAAATVTRYLMIR